MLTPYIQIPTEIVDSEKTYLATLYGFLNATRGDKYRDNRFLQAQRDQITKMIELSQKFKLLTQTDEDPPQEKLPTPEEISNFFNTHSEDFKVYRDYAINYSSYQKIIDINEEPGKSIDKYLKKMRLDGLASALTIQPIQRIPRYELFLTKLHKALPTKDIQSVTQALERILKINQDINDIPSSEKILNILKKEQNFIEKYIEEIQKLSINDPKEKQHWRKEIQLLKSMHQALKNPQSLEAQIIITKNSDHELIEFIHTEIQTRLDKFLGNDDLLLAPSDSEADILALKMDVLNFFRLGPATDTPPPVFAQSNQALNTSIAKDLQQGCTLYRNELASMITQEKDSQKNIY